jgi:ketosteroid isomerase-like protein
MEDQMAAKRAKKAKKAKKAPKRMKRMKRSVKPAKPSIEAVARKIVRATQQPDFPFVTLYTADCTSQEAAGEPARGHAELEAKNARWAQFQVGSKWTARNVWTGKNTVCIEWDGVVQTRDGRTLNLREIAVHEIKDGKIQHERFYYNPNVLGPVSAPAAASAAQ